jgi:hypothetical protein
MFGLHLSIVLDALCALGAMFALWKGGTAERAAALVIIANILIGEIGSYLAPSNSDLIRFVNDGLTALVILGITIRYGALWMGGVMLFYAVQFSLHSFYLVTGRPRDFWHAVINNVDFNGIIWCLIIGAAVAWRGRVKAASAAKGPIAVDGTMGSGGLA